MDGTLLDTVPDLILSVARDGVLLAHGGGRAISSLRLSTEAIGKPLESLWGRQIAELVNRAVRRAIADRATVDIVFQWERESFDARISAVSPDRAVCVIRATRELGSARRLDRRGLLRRFAQSISMAALDEKPLAVCIVQIDGLHDISRMLDAKIAEHVMDSALGRVLDPASGVLADDPRAFIGQLSDNILVVVLNTAVRDSIEHTLAALRGCFEEKIGVGDASFHLSAHAGVAIMGQDGLSAQELIDHARTAAFEAGRGGGLPVCFFSDTLKLRSLARLDVARELRHAIANGDIGLRYVPRHELASGELAAMVGYFRWVDPLRGEVPPAEFLKIAESTGQSGDLSRSVLRQVRDDYAAFEGTVAQDVRISLGPPHHHILSAQFLDDIQSLVTDGGVPPERLELRIAERSYIARDVDLWRSVAGLGVRVVVDEFGRKISSLDLLARGPIWGLQLDRRWATALGTDPSAAKVCRAIIGIAAALELTSIATAVDQPIIRATLLRFGCSQGMGDIYARPAHRVRTRVDEAVVPRKVRTRKSR